MVRILRGPGTGKLFGICWKVTQEHSLPLRPHAVHSTKVQDVRGEVRVNLIFLKALGFPMVSRVLFRCASIS